MINLLVFSVPFPQELTVEKKMSRSCVISWSAPDDSLLPISQYHVCVDSIVRAVVPGSFKCKALIEDIDLSKPINLSVRAVTENGHSPDAACTISLGKGLYFEEILKFKESKKKAFNFLCTI